MLSHHALLAALRTGAITGRRASTALTTLALTTTIPEVQRDAVGLIRTGDVSYDGRLIEQVLDCLPRGDAARGLARLGANWMQPAVFERTVRRVLRILRREDPSGLSAVGWVLDPFLRGNPSERATYAGLARELLHSDIPQVQKQGICLLVHLPDVSSGDLAILRRALDHEEPALRRAAAHAISSLADKDLVLDDEVVPRLWELRNNDPDDEVREAARSALAALSPADETEAVDHPG